VPVRALHRVLEVLVVPKPCCQSLMTGLRKYTSSMLSAAIHSREALEWGVRAAREGVREGLGELIRGAVNDALRVTEPCSVELSAALLLYTAAYSYASERGLKGEAGLLDAAERVLRVSTVSDALSLYDAIRAGDAGLAECLEDAGVTRRRVEYEDMSLEDLLKYVTRCSRAAELSFGREFRRLVTVLLREWGRVADKPLNCYAVALTLYGGAEARRLAESLLSARSEHEYLDTLRRLGKLCRVKRLDYSSVAVGAAVAVYAASLV